MEAMRTLAPEEEHQVARGQAAQADVGPGGAAGRPGRWPRGRPPPPAPGTGGDQRLVDVLGAQQLAEGGRGPGRCRSTAAAGRAGAWPPAAAGGRPGPAGGSGPARPGCGPGPRGPGCSPRPGSRPWRSCGRWPPGHEPPWPQAGDLPDRGVVRGRAGDPAAHAGGAGAAEGDADQHEDDREMPNRTQGEVPFAWKKGLRPVRDPLTPPGDRQPPDANSAAAPPGLVRNCAGNSVRTGQAMSPGAPGARLEPPGPPGGGRPPAAGRAPRPGAGGPRPGRCRRRRSPRRPR
jgi:hypothetical protein